jgi:hypothetical protein
MALSAEFALERAVGLSQGSLPNDDVDITCIYYVIHNFT